MKDAANLFNRNTAIVRQTAYCLTPRQYPARAGDNENRGYFPASLILPSSSSRVNPSAVTR
jgi:hypothetical protein